MELIWTLLNTVLFILFIIICIKAVFAVRKELGFWSFLFLAVCLFSIAFNKSDTDDEKLFTFEDKGVGQNLTKIDSTQNFAIREQILSKQLLSKISLRVKLNKTGRDISIISAQAYRTGFFNGTRWEPRYIDIATTVRAGEYRYKVMGTLDWTLMGFQLYSETKDFQGIIKN